ncbi:hypothetical protein H2248_007772 [Termitomyces sp. 'cryptogamus']|nr:hypothetical protein H2248_007772 [Termitomyces sp. 'cryptogamus']
MGQVVQLVCRVQFRRFHLRQNRYIGVLCSFSARRMPKSNVLSLLLEAGGEARSTLQSDVTNLSLLLKLRSDIFRVGRGRDASCYPSLSTEFQTPLCRGIGKRA